MGMVLALHTISDDNISRVLADPPLIWRVIAPEDPEIYHHTRAEKQPGFLARLFGAEIAEATTDLPDLPKVEGEGIEIDLDKAWHGIHYLLTGTAWEGAEPLNFIVCGGKEVGDVDVGYGPARVFSSREVEKIADALGALDRNALRERFDPKEMMSLEIYPEIWDRDPVEDDTLGYCIEYYDDLHRFLTDAAGNSMGIALYIC
jgi:hypothetical protein